MNNQTEQLKKNLTDVFHDINNNVYELTDDQISIIVDLAMAEFQMYKAQIIQQLDNQIADFINNKM